MRLLVTGARGMMGQDFCRLANQRDHETWPTDVARLERDPEDHIDVRDPSSLEKALRDYRPEMVCHLAALTDVDGCERDPEEAYAVNTVGTQNVAMLCRRASIPMLYISTGSVFPGDKPVPYHEFDDPGPQSVYSRSKWQGERIVRDLLPEHYIVRAGWMFGGGPEDKKFVAKMIELARSRDALRAVDDKFGTPCYTKDISERCLHLMETGLFGTYHGANAGWCSRHEMAEAIVEFAGISDCRVEPCSSAEFPMPAPRPRMEAIDDLHARLVGLPSQRHWRKALKAYMEEKLL